MVIDERSNQSVNAIDTFSETGHNKSAEPHRHGTPAHIDRIAGSRNHRFVWRCSDQQLRGEGLTATLVQRTRACSSGP